MTEALDIPLHIRRKRYDPLPELLELRDQPMRKVDLRFGGQAWLTTRYEDVRQVLGDATTFSNSMEGRPIPFTFRSENPRGDGFLLNYDPPDHTRLRRLLTPEFTVRRIRRLAPRIEAIVDEHLDALEEAGPPADLVSTFALPIPSLVICELLGVPYADRTEFQHHSSVRLDVSLDLDTRGAAIAASRTYMAGLIARQRKDPGEDMIGMLIREHGDELTDLELTGVADLLLLAGHETTSNMLSLGTLLLLQNPGQAAEVREGRMVDEAVEELLRYLSVVHSVTPRTAREDVVVGGQKITAGEILLCSLPAANRDPGLGERMDEFDVTRKIAAHMAFGHGIHHCLGAPLARMEMKIAYPALLKRFPNLAVTLPLDDIDYRPYSIVFGVKSLPVTW
jgi:cytochrome P450